ncbi:CD209 antigen-like protein 2 isoform 2-T2 [Callospermophilus lateralis]|uniref:CD209 antigen-like protein 2 isoform X2 n=1 Tax=Callospermophilus lateralis TaxID=76772 RepID=UPI0040544C2C
MAGEHDPRVLGLPEEKATFGGQRFTEKDPEMLTQSPKSFPGPAGWLTRVPWILLLLLSSLGLCFVLLVTTLVQVSRTPGSPQAKVQDPPSNFSLGAASQEQVLSGLEQVRQQLTWINTSLGALCRPCPWGWEAFQGNCYLFSRTLGTWENSVSSCRDMGAHLVIVNNAAEQRFLRYWDIRKSQRTWIGLSDHNNEATGKRGSPTTPETRTAWSSPWRTGTTASVPPRTSGSASGPPPAALAPEHPAPSPRRWSQSGALRWLSSGPVPSLPAGPADAFAS